MVQSLAKITRFSGIMQWKHSPGLLVYCTLFKIKNVSTDDVMLENCKSVLIILFRLLNLSHNLRIRVCVFFFFFGSLSNMICVCSSNKINSSPKLHKPTADCTTLRIPCLNHVRIKALGVSILVALNWQRANIWIKWRNCALSKLTKTTKVPEREAAFQHDQMQGLMIMWASCWDKGTEVVLVHDFKEGSFSFVWLSSCLWVCEAENNRTDSGSL